jgi:N-methylhydantoinase B/oxoprolinase/acetone carboxylase alpha subunit
LLTKIDRLYVQQGDGVVLRTPGGGGYGMPALRDAVLVEQDALNELEKPAAA